MLRQQITAPTIERVRKSADIDIPLVDAKRRRQAFRLVGPVEKMWREGRIGDGQLAGFRKYERDIGLTSSSKQVLSQYAQSSGGGTMNSEELASQRSDAFARLADVSMWLEPRTGEALKAVVQNDMRLEDIGRNVLMISNRSQAIGRAVEALRQGTWTLAVFYGCLTPSEIASLRPG